MPQILNEEAFDYEMTEDYQTVQNYVTTLFDSLPRVSLSSQNKGSNLIKKLIQQNQLYGKKIIQLSQKFTSIYRKDHIFDRKDFQDKIKQIYMIVIDDIQKKQKPIDEMLNCILTKIKSESYNMLKVGFQQLQQSQARQNQMESIINSNKMIESKIQLKNLSLNSIKDSKSIHPIPNENLYIDNLHPNGGVAEQSIQVSRKQSIQGKVQKSSMKSSKKRQKNILEGEDIPIKKILKIKSLLEEEENIIKQMFEKINDKINQFKINKVNISQEKLSYTKIEDQTNQQNLQSLLEAAFFNRKANLNSVSQLVDLIFGDFDRKIKQQMHSQNKFVLYTKQIDKREEVYSYAVSKLIGQVNNLKNYINQENYHQCSSIVENLISISTKFYELYPSNSIIKDLKVNSQKKNFQMVEKNNYGIQVNTTKYDRTTTKASTEVSKRLSSNQLQIFKLETKVFQMVDKFQKNSLKFKKSVETKEIIQLLNSIRQVFPDRNKISNVTINNGSDIIKFEEQYKKIVSQYEIKQQKIIDENVKKQKKLEKKIKELEETIASVQSEAEKQINLYKQQLKKTTKKLESFQQKYRVSEKKNEQIQKVTQQIKVQIQELRRKYKQQQLQHHHKLQQISRKSQYLSRQLEQKNARMEVLSCTQNELQQKSRQQITLYKKKIVLLQGKNSQLFEEKQLSIKRLQELTLTASISKQKYQQMTIVYQQKIKQVDEMIQVIKTIKGQIIEKDEKVMQLQLEIQKITKIDERLEEELLMQKEYSVKLKEQIQLLTRQRQNYKSIGQLNEDDIQKLKQQIQKVHSAYQQVEQQLQNLRSMYEQLQQRNNRVQTNNQDYRQKLEEGKKISQKLGMQQKGYKEAMEKIDRIETENVQLIAKAKNLENELFLLRRELKSIKQQCLQSSRESRQLRQQLQKHRQQQTLLKGRYKIELQTSKIEARKKGQQMNRLKDNYEEKLQVLEGKYKELQKFISQKQILAKISNNHSTQ